MTYSPIIKRPLVLAAIIAVLFCALILTLPLVASIIVATAVGILTILCALICLLLKIFDVGDFLKAGLISLLCLALLLSFCIYILAYRNSAETPAENFLATYADTQTETQFTAKIVDKENGINYANYTLLLSEPAKIKAKLLVFGSEFSDVGDIVSGKADVVRPEIVTSRGYEEAKFLKADEIFVKLDATSSLTLVSKGQKSPLEKLRQQVDRNILRYTGSGSNIEVYALSKGLFMGDASSISDTIAEDFRRCGISHILTVSGLHFSIIVAFLSFVLGKLKCPKTLRAVMIILFCFAFAAFAGFDVPVVRSGIMAGIVGLSLVAKRKADGLTSLSAAAIVIVCISPYSVFDVGAALSFLASAGILLSSGLVSATLSALFRWVRNSSGKRFFAKAFTPVFCAATVSLAACAFTLCVTALSFGEVSVISVVVNVITGPAVTFMMLLLTLISVLSFVPSGVCHLVCLTLGLGVKLVAKYLLAVSHAFSDLRFASVKVPENLVVWGLLAALTVLLIVPCVFSTKKLSAISCAVSIAIFTLCVCLFTVLEISEASREKILVCYDKNGAYLSVRCREENSYPGDVSYIYVSGGAKNALHFSKDSDICDKIGGQNTYIVAQRGDGDAQREFRCITEFDEKYGIRRLLIPKTDSTPYKSLAQMLIQHRIEFEYYENNSFSTENFRIDFTPLSDGYNALVSRLDESTVIPTLLFCDIDRYGSHVARVVETSKGGDGDGDKVGDNVTNISDGILQDERIPVYIHSSKRKTKDFGGILSERPNVYIMNLYTDFGIAGQSNLPFEHYCEP